MLSIKRCDLPEVPSARHWIITLGVPSVLALRLTRGKLSRHGTWHPMWPCLSVLRRNRRVWG